MKKYFVILLFIMLCLLSACVRVKAKKNVFFTNEELKMFGVSEFPQMDFYNSYIKVYTNLLDGYFNINETKFDEYASDIFSYFKNSDYKYGGILTNTIQSFILAYASYDWYTFSHLELYKDGENSYSFLYEVNNNLIYHIRYEIVSFEIKKNTYNVHFKISKDSRVREYRTIEDYQEIEINKEYIEDNNLLKIDHHIYYLLEGQPEYLSIYLDINPAMGKFKIDGDATLSGHKKTFNILYDSQNHICDLTYYFDLVEPYSDGDLVIDYYMVGDGIILIQVSEEQ